MGKGGIFVQKIKSAIRKNLQVEALSGFSRVKQIRFEKKKKTN